MDLSFFPDSTLPENTGLRWVIALVVAVVVYVALRMARKLLRSRAREAAARTRNGVDDVVVAVLAAAGTFFFLAAAVFVASHVLALDDTVRNYLRQGFVLILLVQVVVWGNTALATVLDTYRRQSDLDPTRRTSLSALSFVGRLMLFSVVLLLALDNLGFEINTLLAGLGITSLAVALALQNILGDLFASLSILFDKPFEIGDFIVVGDYQGTVENVGLRTTRLRSLSGEQLVFGNHDLLASRIRNYKRMQERRVVFTLGVEYGTPSDALERILTLAREAVEAQQDVRFDRAHFKSFGAYSLDFEIVYTMLVADYAAYMDAQQAINLQLYRRFEEAGIAFAFPTQTLMLDTASGQSLPLAVEGTKA
ncbi:MAG: mechanosensitive ion channel family protein [Trueperaceae bacterium]